MRHSLPPLRLLTTFEAVLRTGGVQNAAKELNVTQPAVSQALRALEDHLGASLLDRRKRPATLTDAGHVLFRAVSKGLDEIGQAVQQIRLMGAVDEDLVTIACTICTGTYWLMPRLAAFYSEHPHLTVRVATSPSVPRFSPETDLLIRYGHGQWDDGRSELLFKERIVPVCSPKLLEEIGSDDFSRATLLDVERPDECWPQWQDYLHMAGHRGTHCPVRTFDNYVQATQAAIAGMGIMLGWVSNSEDLLRDGRLVEYRDTPLIPEDAFFVVAPLDRRSKLSARLLADHLHNRAAEPRP
ncbi:LysR substrate-binding domain-containing protein [Aureimonas sp. D3]|uniref:LysR substrate-binding domain-containing protein n=1 Tax=Aureimonas sp. D3 TaxID=1638164 RepID=UPI000ABEC13B|nr:LysR substrate-binding domain-containing protein [Aureimonas sp. D3]